MKFKDKVKAFKRIPADKLVDNPANWRTHPEAQRNALSALLSEVGFVGAVIVRSIEGGNYEIIDGHLRKELMTGGKVPALICDLDDNEVKLLLASYDPLAGMAEANSEMLGELLKSIETDNDEIGDLLKSIAAGYDIEVPDFQPTDADEQPRLDQLDPKMVKCPHCEKEFDSRGCEVKS